MDIWSWKTSSDNLSNAHMCLRRSQNGNSFCLMRETSGSFLDTSDLCWSLTIKAAPQERSRGHPAALGVPHGPQQPCRAGHWAIWAAGTRAITMWLNAWVSALRMHQCLLKMTFCLKMNWMCYSDSKTMVFLCYGSFQFFFFVLQITMSSTECDQWQIYEIVWIWLCLIFGLDTERFF